MLPKGWTPLATALRLDQIRRCLVSEAASAQKLALAAEQLCKKNSKSAVELRQEAMSKLSAALRIDNHPLLRERSATLRAQDIPASRSLLALRKITQLVLRDAEKAQEETNRSIESLHSRISSQLRRIEDLQNELDVFVRDELDAYIADNRAQSVFSSKVLCTVRSELLAQVSAMARANWPKRSNLDSALQDLERLNRSFTVDAGPRISTEKLRERLRKIAHVLDATKQVRQELRGEREAERGRKTQLRKLREADRRRKEQEIADAARCAAIEIKQREAMHRLQAELESENLLIEATAERLLAGEGIAKLIEDLKRQGVSEPVRIAAQAVGAD